MNLCIGFYHNEIEWLPEKVRYCRDNLLDLYVIDNESTDGTLEYLQRNKIPHHSFSTNGEFPLSKLQKEMIHTIEHINPEWVVYLDADLFVYCKEPLAYILDKSDGNVLEFPRINFFPVDDKRFRYYKYINNIQYIYKHIPGVKYQGDNLDYPGGKKVCRPDGIMVNHSGTIEHRKDEYERRKKAWQNGEPKSHGFHLKDLSEGKNPDGLKDIFDSEYYNLLNKRGKND